MAPTLQRTFHPIMTGLFANTGDQLSIAAGLTVRVLDDSPEIRCGSFGVRVGGAYAPHAGMCVVRIGACAQHNTTYTPLGLGRPDWNSTEERESRPASISGVVGSTSCSPVEALNTLATSFWRASSRRAGGSGRSAARSPSSCPGVAGGRGPLVANFPKQFQPHPCGM